MINDEWPPICGTGLLTDAAIDHLARHGMIDPYVPRKTSLGGRRKVISYGLSSFGYDVRLGNNFRIFTNAYGAVIDPKNFDDRAFVPAISHGEVLIPPNSFVLAESVERFKMPKDVLGVCLGKSTYARCGIVVNVTPLEPGWEGVVTIEISNTAPLPAKVYVGEGVMQVLFFRGESSPQRTYVDLGGKYQDQDGIVPAKV